MKLKSIKNKRLQSVSLATHITASVADLQGNRTTMKLRFWVEQLGPRVLSLDVRQLSQRHLIVRIQDDAVAAGHTVLCSDDLSKPISAWTRVTTVNAFVEANQVERLELSLPDRFGATCFLLVQRP